MSKPQGELKFNYDNYDDDFHREVDDSHGRHDFNMQTSGLHDKPDKEEKYEADFHNDSQVKSRAKETSANREKMIEQNIKLKTQIYELAKQMDEILAKEKKQKKYGLHADE